MWNAGRFEHCLVEQQNFEIFELDNGWPETAFPGSLRSPRTPGRGSLSQTPRT